MKLRRTKKQARHAFISPDAYRTAIEARDEATTLAAERLSTITRLCTQLDETRDQVDDLHDRLDTARSETQTARREALVLRQDRARQADTIADLQQANERLCREAVDRADTPAEVTA